MKIVSGGQTGVARAALDVALELGIPCGGWCPHGRNSETGAIPAKYTLQETPLPDHDQCAEWNVKSAHGTLVLAIGKPAGDTALTIGYARRYSKPCLVADLNHEVNFDAILEWFEGNHIKVLNVAGPSESQHPGVHGLAVRFLKDLLADEQ